MSAIVARSTGGFSTGDRSFTRAGQQETPTSDLDFQALFSSASLSTLQPCKPAPRRSLTRESSAAYDADFAAEKGSLRYQNTYQWKILAC